VRGPLPSSAKLAGQQALRVRHLAAQAAFWRRQHRPGYHSPQQGCVPASDSFAEQFWQLVTRVARGGLRLRHNIRGCYARCVKTEAVV